MELKKQNIETILDFKDIDKASSTWSGFLYQGKVAIYTVLKYINKFYPDVNEISRYKLEIEYLEDFAILKDNQHISLHQVKAKPTTNTIGSYNEANLNLLGKLEKYDSVGEVNLHTAVNIKAFTKQDLFTNLENFKVEGKKQELTTYKNLVLQPGKFDELYGKLKISCNDGLVPFERVIELKEIKNFILNELKDFYSKWDDEKLRDKNGSLENIEHIYSNFINILEEEVHKDHLKEQEEGKIIINFENIMDLLENKSVFTFTNKTISGILLHNLSEDFNQYCLDYRIEEDDIELKEYWSNHIRNLKVFLPEEFFLLCRKLTPHLVLQNKERLDIDEFRKLMQSDAVCDSFLHGVMQLNSKISDPIQAHSAYVIGHRGERYALSTINKRGPYAHETVGRDIYENLNNDDELFQMLFEISAYINSNIENEYTGNITNVYSDTDSEVIRYEDSQQTVTNQKTIRFTKVDKLKETILE